MERLLEYLIHLQPNYNYIPVSEKIQKSPSGNYAYGEFHRVGSHCKSPENKGIKKE